MNFQILNLSHYDPEKDIIIVNVYVGKMRPDAAQKHVSSVRRAFAPLFGERGFDVVYIPYSHEMDSHEMVQVGNKPPFTIAPEEVSESTCETDEDLEYFTKKFLRAMEAGVGVERAQKQLETAKDLKEIHDRLAPAYDPLSTVEDFVFPVYKDTRGSKVDHLPEITELPEDDQKKLPFVHTNKHTTNRPYGGKRVF